MSDPQSSCVYIILLNQVGDKKMMTDSLHGSNRLIRKTILRMFPSSFAATITVSIALMMDTLLAGAMLGQQAIAAVAIGLPVINIFQALTQTVFSGAAVKLAVHAGRGDRRSMNQTYSLGFVSTVVLGLIFILVCLSLAPALTRLFGGAGNAEVAAQATLYLRGASVCILMGSLNTYLSKVLALYGYQKAVFRSALIAMVGNIVFSVLYIWLLPDELAIAGLGIGTWTGGTVACICSYLSIKAYKIPLRFKFQDVNMKELPEIVRRGISTSSNNLADGVVAGLVNNIIVSGFGGDTLALSVYTAVKGVYSFGVAAVLGTTTASAPLFGILYGARDKNGLLRTVKEGLKVGIAASIAWCGLLIALIPVLARFYGMEGTPQFQSGVVMCLLFMPLCLLMRILIQLFESTEKTGMGMLYAIVPDSVIYPILLALVLPVLQYNGIWLAYSANAIPFLIGLYLIRSLRHKTLRMSVDRILCLDETIRDNVPVLDISILSSNTDVTGISEQVQDFLMTEDVSKRTSYMAALCLEELAADFVTHAEQENLKEAARTIMDIKLFSDETSLRIIIRNAAKPYNPLDFELDDSSFAKVGVKMAQKFSRHIDYAYVYRMNIITIDLDK